MKSEPSKSNPGNPPAGNKPTARTSFMKSRKSHHPRGQNSDPPRNQGHSRLVQSAVVDLLVLFTRVRRGPGDRRGDDFLPCSLLLVWYPFFPCPSSLGPPRLFL